MPNMNVFSVACLMEWLENHNFLNNFYFNYPIASKFSENIWALIVIVFAKNEYSCIKIQFLLTYDSIKGCSLNLKETLFACNNMIYVLSANLVELVLIVSEK